MKKNNYKVIDSKGRIYLTKDLRDKLNVDIGDIVKVEFNKNNINIKKVELIEIDDKTPEAIQDYIKATIKNMDKKKCIEILDEIIVQLKED